MGVGALNDDDHIRTRPHYYTQPWQPGSSEASSKYSSPKGYSLFTERNGIPATSRPRTEGRPIFGHERPASHYHDHPGPGHYQPEHTQTKRTASRTVFSQEELPEERGRGAFMGLQSGYGTVNASIYKTDSYKFERDHVHDMRGFSTTLGSASNRAFGSGAEEQSKVRRAPAFGFGSTERRINPRSWKPR